MISKASVAGFLGLMAIIQQAKAARFWLGGQDPIVLSEQRKLNSNDFFDLFQRDTSWGSGESRLSVFKVSTQFVLSARDDQLRLVFSDMERRRIKMAVEIGAVVRLDSCGMGEGYAPRDLSDRVGRRLHSLGLHLDYMALDEPVWYTHEKTWGRAANGAANCEYPLAVVAQRVAMSVNDMRRYFPEIAFGDIEVLASDRTPPPQLIADYAQFARLLERDLGIRMAFFHADIAWHTTWQPMIAPLKRQMHQVGVPFGVIVGGSPEQTSDQQWVKVALQRLAVLTSNSATDPDDIVIQSWQRLPSQYLPESRPGTSTYLLREAERAIER